MPKKKPAVGSPADMKPAIVETPTVPTPIGEATASKTAPSDPPDDLEHYGSDDTPVHTETITHGR